MSGARLCCLTNAYKRMQSFLLLCAQKNALLARANMGF